MCNVNHLPRASGGSCKCRLQLSLLLFVVFLSYNYAYHIFLHCCNRRKKSSPVATKEITVLILVMVDLQHPLGTKGGSITKTNAKTNTENVIKVSTNVIFFLQ